MRSWFIVSTVEDMGQLAIEDIGDQCTFARARDACHNHEFSQGDINGDVFEIVFTRSSDCQGMTIPFSTLLGQLNAAAPGGIISGKKFRISRNFIEGALCNDLAAMFSCTRANINDVIGGTHSVLIMFNYQQRITQLAQACQPSSPTFIIALVEANTW